MRALVCIFALILVLPAILATDDADAAIKPIPRPDKVSKEPVAASRSSAVAPISRPVVHRKVVVRATKAVVRRAKPAAHAAIRTVRAHVRTSIHRRSRARAASRVHRVRVLARSRGGRYVPPAISRGGRQPLPV